MNGTHFAQARGGLFRGRIAREIRMRIADRVAGFQVSAPFGNVDLAVQVLAP